MLDFIILLIDLVSLIFQLLEYKKNNRTHNTVIVIKIEIEILQ